MRRVFGSHSQCAHVWAQQVQSEGRAGNIFFRDTMIFSYGEHYLAAKIHTVKGQRFALVRSDPYSPSTGKHLSEIRSALRGLMPYFQVEDVGEPRGAVKQLDLEANDGIKHALKRLKITDEGSIRLELESIEKDFEHASELRGLLGMPAIKPKKKDLDAVQAHLEYRLKRYRELNTPEQAERREKERERRLDRKARAFAEKERERIEKFRRGEYVGHLSMPYEILRIVGDSVQTSRGASVPLADARRLYMAIKNGLDVKGKTIGHFTVISVYPYRNADLTETKLVQIGCHKILLTEAENLFERFEKEQSA